MRFWYDSTPRVAQAKGPAASCCYVAEALESVFPGSLFLGSANLLFGLEPVVEFRAGLIALLNVEFIGSSSYSFFERKRLNRGHLCACGFWHGGIYLRKIFANGFREATANKDSSSKSMRRVP